MASSDVGISANGTKPSPEARRSALARPTKLGGEPMPEETLSVVDNRTGRSYEIPIRDGAIPATELQKITADGAGTGMMSYDPAFLNTASCRSAITYIDGEREIGRASCR